MAPVGGRGRRRRTLHRLVISCPDQPRIVAAVSTFLFAAGANIISSAQHSTDPRDGSILMRMVFDLALEARSPHSSHNAFESEVARPMAMKWERWEADRPKRIGILVSREDHCLLDLFWRWRRAELDADLGLVISNHAT